MENFNLRNRNFIPSGKNYVLIIYDISNDKIRYKFSRKLMSYGFRVQKSAFEAILSNMKYNKLVKEIDNFIKDDKDSVRVYKFNGYGEVSFFGDCKKISNDDVIIV